MKQMDKKRQKQRGDEPWRVGAGVAGELGEPFASWNSMVSNSTKKKGIQAEEVEEKILPHRTAPEQLNLNCATEFKRNIQKENTLSRWGELGLGPGATTRSKNSVYLFWSLRFSYFFRVHCHSILRWSFSSVIWSALCRRPWAERWRSFSLQSLRLIIFFIIIALVLVVSLRLKAGGSLRWILIFVAHGKDVSARGNDQL